MVFVVNDRIKAANLSTGVKAHWSEKSENRKRQTETKKHLLNERRQPTVLRMSTRCLNCCSKRSWNWCTILVFKIKAFSWSYLWCVMTVRCAVRLPDWSTRGRFILVSVRLLYLRKCNRWGWKEYKKKNMNSLQKAENVIEGLFVGRGCIKRREFFSCQGLLWKRRVEDMKSDWTYQWSKSYVKFLHKTARFERRSGASGQ